MAKISEELMPGMNARQLQELKIRVDQIAELKGAGIGFLGDGNCVVLRDSQHSSGLDTWVLLDEQDIEGDLPTAAEIQEPSLALELVGAGLNCVGAVLAWSAMGGVALASAGSAGAAIPLSLIAWAAVRATTVQCGVSIIRSIDVGLNDGRWTRWLDSQEFYSWASYALDGISLLGVAASTSAAIRAAKAIRNATGRSSLQILKQMSRAERKRLVQELIRLDYPGISNSGVKELIRIGQFPARLQAAEISKRIFTQLKDAISASLSFGSSGAAGGLHYLYVHIYQE
ncbi:MAG TPA: hypothetical protein VH374_17415 [Polyangia bacterium]|jgi:hypothetical protein|nr:hypothetical protein [Polyangia bacterium]